MADRLVVDPAAAAWIREHVLPAAYLRGTVNQARCPCQWGPSGHCGAGRHERCNRTIGWHRHGEPAPETHLTDARGVVIPGPTAVWRTGTPCRWLCPCRCHTEVLALIPAPAPGPGRSSRAGGNGYIRISSTDLLREDEDQPLALW